MKKLLLVLFAVFVISCTDEEKQESGSEIPETPAEAVTYTVTFYTDGGSIVESQTVENGKTAARPADPTKPNKDGYGYTFLDWYDSSALTAVFDFTVPITSDVALYAKWTKTFLGLSEEEVSKVFTGTAYRELDSGTEGTAGPDATYAVFGDWPQTAKADDVIIYDTITVSQGFFTYYKGNDDCWYAKVNESYFKVEPIKWRVLDTSSKLLLAENILATNGYYHFINPSNYSHNNISNDRTIDEKTVYPNNYKHSLIRAWLNGISYEKKI